MFDRNLVDIDVLIEEINAVLPQIQCRQCGFAGCKPYAVAITKVLPILINVRLVMKKGFRNSPKLWE